MFADPITITVAGVGKVMARIQTNGTSAVYQSADQLWKLLISHQVSKDGKIRTLERLEQKKVVADPLTALLDYQTLVTQHVIERPNFGFVIQDVKDQVAGHNTWDSLAATQDKAFALES